MTTADPTAPPDDPVAPSSTEPREEILLGTRLDVPDAARPAFRIGVAGTLIVLAILLYGAAPEGIVREAVPLFLAAIVAQLAPLYLSRAFDPFSPAHYHTMISGVTLVSILAQIYSMGDMPYGGMPRLSYDERIDLLQKISLAYIVQAIGYCIGYYFTNGFAGLVRTLPRFPDFHWHQQRFWLLSFGLWGAFAIGFARFQSLAGSWSLGAATAATKAVWRAQDDRMAWLFRALQLGMVPLFALTARFLTRSTKSTIRRQWMVILLLLTGLLALMAARIGQRGYAIIMIIGLAGIAHYVWRRIPTPVILGAALAAIVATNFLGRVRVSDETTTTQRPVVSGIMRPAQVLAELENDRDHLAATGCAMYFFPERVDYLKGQSFLNILLAPIPRALWAGKQSYVSMSENGIVWSLIEQPVPMPWQFVYYANFGWIGMFVAMAMWGAFHKSLFRWVHQSGYHPPVVAIYGAMLATFSPTASGIAWFLGAGLPLYVMMKLMKRR